MLSQSSKLKDTIMGTDPILTGFVHDINCDGLLYGFAKVAWVVVML
jgi:hypothetical protein